MPHDHNEWQNLDDYFFARRNWTPGPILVIFVLTLCLEIANITSLIESESWDSLMRYLALNTVALAMIAIALLSKHPRIVRVARLG